MTDLTQRIMNQLTADQVETLRHVYTHKGSKEIARIMGVSPHTVDQRMRAALKKLQLNSRVDAAKLLACHGIFDNVTPYQSLIYQPVYLVEEDAFADVQDCSGDTPHQHRPKTGHVIVDKPVTMKASGDVMADEGRMKTWALWIAAIALCGGGVLGILFFLLTALGHG